MLAQCEWTARAILIDRCVDPDAAPFKRVVKKDPKCSLILIASDCRDRQTRAEQPGRRRRWPQHDHTGAHETGKCSQSIFWPSHKDPFGAIHVPGAIEF